MMNTDYNGYTNWETRATMLYEEENFRNALDNYKEKIIEIERTKGRWKAIMYAKDIIEKETLNYYYNETPPWKGLLQEFIIQSLRRINFTEIAELFVDEILNEME